MASCFLPLGKPPIGITRPSNRCAISSSRAHLQPIGLPGPNPQQILNYKLKINKFHPLIFRQKLKPAPALNSDEYSAIQQGAVDFFRSESYKQWDSLSAKFAGGANIPFLLLQLPQIILNARNLTAGNYSALLAVPWLGMLTGLLGNLSLLSYFIKKRETEAIVVQTLGVISIYVVLVQLAMGEAMPVPHFIGTSIVVACGLIVNFMNYFNLLKPQIWEFWVDFITIGGLSALPQVIWSTFVPFIPNTILPGAIAFVMAVSAVVMARTGKLSEKGTKFVGSISGWTATLLFIWMSVSQMWTNMLNPSNIKGLSAVSMLLAMVGNGLMIPRALLIRDLMWFTGSCWSCVFYGLGNLVCLYCYKCISREFFLAAVGGFIAWIGFTLWRDTIAYGYTSPFTSLKELVYGS